MLPGLNRAFRLVAWTAFSLLVGAEPTRAAPALWAAHGADATVYLFGTIHVLKPDNQWRSPAIDQALARSSAVWLELGDAPEKAVMAKLLTGLGFDRARPLSARLPRAEIERIDAIAKAGGVPGGEKGLDAMRPWLAAVSLGFIPIQRAGYLPGQGADEQIRALATKAGKHVEGLETADTQLSLLADLPDTVQEELLTSAIDEESQDPHTIDALVNAWLSGDVDTIDRLGGTLRRDAPDLYRIIVVQRNETFADRIAQMLKGTGAIFVAVGAEHLAGTDSVQTNLKKRGIETERISGP